MGTGDFLNIPSGGDAEPPVSDRATDESVAIANRKLSKKAERTETKDVIVHRSICTIFVVGVAAVVVMIAVVTWHWVTAWHFLSPTQLDKLEQFLFAVASTRIVTEAGERWFKTDDDKK